MGWKDRIVEDSSSWRDRITKDVEEPSLMNQIGHGLTSAIPVLAGAGAGMLATPESFGLATLPAAALGYAGGKELEDMANSALFDETRPDQSLSENIDRVGGNLLEGAAQEMGGQVLGPLVGKGIKYAGQSVKTIAESPLLTKLAKLQPGPRAAEKAGQFFDLTNPRVDKVIPKTQFTGIGAKEEAADIANKTNQIVQKAANEVPRSPPGLTDMFKGQPPPMEPTVRSAAEQIGGRAAAYGAIPVPYVGGITAGVQAASDAALVTQGAAKFTLEQIIPRMGVFSKPLQDALSRGPTSLAATHYLLQNIDPQYRQQYKQVSEEIEGNEK